MPFPYTDAALWHVAARIEQVQETLARSILVENLSSYLTFNSNEMGEGEFLAELSRRTGCGILFDINNLYVNACNPGVDAHAFIRALPAQAVAEYHLAGHSNQGDCLVDTHGHPVCKEVWSLYQTALQQIGPRPTLAGGMSATPDLAVSSGLPSIVFSVPLARHLASSSIGRECGLSH